MIEDGVRRIRAQTPEVATAVPESGFRRRRAIAAVAPMAIALLAACSSAPAPDAERPAPDVPTSESASASAGCESPPAEPGRSIETLSSGGDERTYLRYVPERAAADGPAPLIVDLTAYSPASLQEGFSGFTTERPDGTVLADDEGIVIVTPEPTNGSPPLLTWNYVGTDGWSDDQAFVTDLLDAVGAEVCIDTSRTFLTGFAVGGVFASIVACEQTERFAALATVAGLYAPDGCEPSTPLPVISFHGTGDRFVPFEGSIGSGPAGLGLSAETIEGLTFMAARDGAEASSSAWAGHAGCDRDPSESSVAEGVSRQSWAGCDDDVAIELYVIEDGEHTWPGSTGMVAVTDLLGPVSESVDATELIWDFFEAQTST